MAELNITLEGYTIYSDGTVVSPLGKTLKKTPTSHGYQTVCFKNKNVKIHRLVAMAYLPNPNNLPCVNHKDGDKTNNNYQNLEWCTHSHNTKHAWDNDLMGDRKWVRYEIRRLTKETVLAIRDFYRNSSYSKTAARFGISRGMVRDIINNRTYKDV